MAALCVQAIWMTRAHSISSRGLAPSMNAKLAFTAISQIPLFGSRAAAGVGGAADRRNDQTQPLRWNRQ